MTRIVYSIGAKFAGGGIGNTAHHAVSGLQRHGLLQRLLCSSAAHSDIPVAKIRQLGWPSRALRKAALYDGQRRLHLWHNRLYDRWAASQLEPCDIFHGWNGFCLATLIKAKQMGAITVVERASSHPVEQANLLREEYGRFNLPFHQPDDALERNVAELETADFVTVPSQTVWDGFIKQGFDPQKLILLPFGVDLERFRPGARSEDDEKRPFRVLFVGHVGVRKGIIYLLKAWERLGWREAELWIVGRVEAGVEPLLTPFRQHGNIRWLGHVPDPVRLFQTADLFVYPTLEEGSALVVYEALACGLPVLTTPQAGSIITNGQDGFLFPIRDVDQLVEKIAQLHENEQLRQQVGQAARATVERFSWQDYGNRLTDAMQRLMHEVGR